MTIAMPVNEDGKLSETFIKLALVPFFSYTDGLGTVILSLAHLLELDI